MLPSLTPASQPQQPSVEWTPLTVSVVICAYTEDRWPLLQRSVASVQHQRRTPMEIIVCVDHNDALLERCRRHWAHPNRQPFGPGGGAGQQVPRSSRFGPKYGGRARPRRHRGVLG